MTDQTLLRSNRNELFEIIEQHAMDPVNFLWSVERSLIDPTLEVSRLAWRADARLYYQFDYANGLEHAQFSPGVKRRGEQARPGSWDRQKDHFTSWLRRIRDEVSQPDLWRSIADMHSLVKVSDESLTDLPISADEADRIRVAIDKLKSTLAAEYSLPEEQYIMINAKLDGLAALARSQGRFTWVHTAIGVIVSIAWAISPDDLPYYYRLIEAALSPFVKLIGG